jgi:hypothetical protein
MASRAERVILPLRYLAERRPPMKNDFYTKAVLTIIAVALLIIALNPWVACARVEAAAASQEGVVSAIYATLVQIANGTCRNTKICEPSSK